jgi:protein SCO1/2
MFDFLSTRIRQVRRNLLVTLVALCSLGGMALLSGCGQRAPAFENLDITGNTHFGHDFALADANGKMRSLADYKDKAVVMVFGYTHCPDVCPTTVAELSQAMQQLGPDDAKRVQVLFVTVDPQRDTGALLSQYATAFNPSFQGLRPANDSQLKQVTQDFHIYYTEVPGASPDNYTMNHTAASMVFDPTGKLRLYVRDGQGVAPWVHDLKLLLG